MQFPLKATFGTALLGAIVRLSGACCKTAGASSGPLGLIGGGASGGSSAAGGADGVGVGAASACGGELGLRLAEALRFANC